MESKLGLPAAPAALGVPPSLPLTSSFFAGCGPSLSAKKWKREGRANQSSLKKQRKVIFMNY